MAQHDDIIVSAQLRLGDGDLPSYRKAEILAKIDAAQQFAGLSRLLFLPSHNPAINKGIIDHCRKQGIEVYLWYKVLTDNDIILHTDELVEDAWGKRGAGETGLWRPIFDTDESFLFGCPTNPHYNDLVLNKCRQSLEMYDGLFVDVIGYPLASLGIEALFSCFCPHCMALDSRMPQWRKNCREVKEYITSCTDADLRKLGTFKGMTRHLGTNEWMFFRTNTVTNLAKRYAALAREMGKPIGIDLLSPALALQAGQVYSEFGALADWLKPRIYCHIYGPSSIPLEYYCMAMGFKKWGRRLSMPAVMEFISNSIDLELPQTPHKLTSIALSPDAMRIQILQARTATSTPVHPGIECSLHPDFESGLNERTVRNYVSAAKGAGGLVLTWNLLYIPDVFLRITGETLQNREPANPPVLPKK